MYVMPLNKFVPLLATNEARRRGLYEQDAKLKARNWLNTDAGRGPVRGFGGSSGRAATVPRR